MSAKESKNIIGFDEKIISECPILTENEAKEAISKQVNESYCLGSMPQINLNSFHRLYSFRYTLETYGETRSMQTVSEPVEVDYPITSFQDRPRITGLWEKHVEPNELFVNQKCIFELLNTSRIEYCTRCGGKGKRTCPKCDGSGMIGFGRQRRGCFECHKNGKIACSECERMGKIKRRSRLMVSFESHCESSFKRLDCVPINLLKASQGKIIYRQEAGQLEPISHFHDPDLKHISEQAIQSHLDKYSQNNCHILAQRHTLIVIPITECSYTWKNESKSFYVYGLENRVYCESYPQKHCCLVS